MNKSNYPPQPLVPLAKYSGQTTYTLFEVLSGWHETHNLWSRTSTLVIASHVSKLSKYLVKKTLPLYWNIVGGCTNIDDRINPANNSNGRGIGSYQCTLHGIICYEMQAFPHCASCLTVNSPTRWLIAVLFDVRNNSLAIKRARSSLSTNKSKR